MSNFISGGRFIHSISRPLRIFCDNSIAVIMAKNNKSDGQNMHIDIKYLIIRECIKDK